SMSSASDHIDHVKTQLPYALSAAIIAIAFGFVPSAYKVHPGISLIVCIGAAFAVVRWFGKDPEKVDLKSLE
ncbi:MAG: Na+/H+ antiporter NhaC family protein, partial [Candidatus Wallbacteria bacterium]|nr:Na+/H+ antiporter NhaC family protein [Candidatus Wallbacteria bacterium]